MISTFRRCVCSSAARPARVRHSLMFLNQKLTSAEQGKQGYYDEQCDKLDINEDAYVINLCKIWTEMMKERRDYVQKKEDHIMIRYDRDKWLPAIDQLQPCVAYEGITELENASLAVRKVLSVNYGTRRDKTSAWKKALVDSVRKHPLDTDSIEARIGFQTALIRHIMALIDEMKEYTELKPSRLHTSLGRSLGHRRRLMSTLRESDKASFDKVLSTLGIAYHTPVLNEDEPDYRRKKWVEKAIIRRMRIVKEERLEKLRVKLDEQRAMVGEDQQRRLKEIEEEMKKAEEDIVTSSKVLFGSRPPHAKPFHPSTVDAITEQFKTNHLYMNIDKEPADKRLAND